MRRRTYLRLASLGTVGLGGCAGAGDGTDRSATPAPSAGSVRSPTGAPRSPAPASTAGSTSPLDGLRRSTEPRDSGEMRRLTYEQTYQGKETTLSVDLPEALVEYYGRRYRSRDFGSYVSDGYDDQYVAFLASRFTAYGEREGLSTSEVVGHVMAFVQQLPYTSDIVGTGFNEYPKYPVETLADRGGDCEDTSLLLAALLDELGYGTVLLLLPEAEHAALGVAGEAFGGYGYTFRGERYYYLESTASGWSVGQAPENVQGVSATIVPINERPSLVLAWGTEVVGDEVRVEALLRNAGKAAAEDAWVGFQAADAQGTTLASVDSSTASLGVDGEHRFRLAARNPDEAALQARVGVFLGDQLHDVDETGVLRTDG